MVGSRLLAGCAVTETTCPTGTTLVTHQRGETREEYCTLHDAARLDIPVPGTTYESQIAMNHPPPMPGGVEGPFTSWFSNGKVASHGRYVVSGTQSVPEGLWAFWYPNGNRQVYGLYHLGEPIGCFAHLDENGALSTGTVNGHELTVAPCTPPPDNEVAIVEGRARIPLGRVRADISIQALLGPNNIPASNDDPAGSLHASPVSFDASARLRFGRLRVGPLVGINYPSTGGGRSLIAGATVGWELPAFHPRVDTEIDAEIAAEQIEDDSSHVTTRGFVVDGSASFWTIRPAVQAEAAFLLSPGLAATLGIRMEGLPERHDGRDVDYCFGFSNCMTVHETWSIGGFAYGVTLGLRVLLR